MRAELRRLQQQIGVTTIYVTHDQGEALAMSDLIAVMEHGRIVQLDEPRAIYFRPANEFVASFIGAANLLSGTTAAALPPAAIGTLRLEDGTAIACLFPAGSAGRTAGDGLGAAGEYRDRCRPAPRRTMARTCCAGGDRRKLPGRQRALRRAGGGARAAGCRPCRAGVSTRKRGGAHLLPGTRRCRSAEPQTGSSTARAAWERISAPGRGRHAQPPASPTQRPYRQQTCVAHR